MPSISTFMVQDHDRLDDLYNKFKNIKTSVQSKAKEIFSEFKTDLQKHILWEEEILFPLFENKTGMSDTGPTAVMKMEHKKIKRYLGEIINQLTNGNVQTDNLEAGLIDVLSEHNLKEENILYPMIDNSINDTELEDVFLKIKDLSPENYKD